MQPIVVNSLEVRLAETRADLDAAQALRYKIFYEEMQAQASAETRTLERDFDRFDPVCDHLLVVDRDRSSHGAPCVVGTYRFLRRSVAQRNFGFYSADEYDLRALGSFPGEIMELGRSCVHIDYRTRFVMQLLWRGIAEYVACHQVELMFGCASFAGTDPMQMMQGLSYLHHRHMAPASWRPRALKERYVDMALLPAEKVDEAQALRQLPPLLKGYLRLGGYVGEGAVIDPQFNTTDVCILVETMQVTDKYYRHYRGEAPRFNQQVAAEPALVS